MLIANALDRSQTERHTCPKFEQVIQEVVQSAEFLHCQYHDGHLVIRGTVDSYLQKQTAQEAVRQLPGVRAISNQLQVRSSTTTATR